MYFELIFVYDVIKRSNFILFACGYPVILTPFIGVRIIIRKLLFPN